MQQHKHFWNTRRLVDRRASLLILLGASVLLAMLIVAGRGSARAAPQSGGASLTIVSSDGNTLTLQFDNWVPNEPLTLSYSPNRDCSASKPLPDPTFQVTGDSFLAPYTLPTDIPPGTYYLCASDPKEGPIASQNTMFITNDGSVESTPTTPGSTPTGGSPTATSSSSGGSATATPGSGNSSATSTPGSQGATATASNNNSGGNTLVAIIVLCLLVMLLLVYLIRLWLQGRQPSGQPPAGGGQQGP
ncbi:MAG TPA: hypothetical protein VFU69_06560 [Ktedonobacterales bacterium]|nr:hypothetical protein [Ktedonobacterales bacterium]